MSDLGVGEWRQRAYQHRDVLGRQLEEISDLNRLTQERLDETREAREAARVEAATAFLPSFDPVSLEQCERLAGLAPGWAALQIKRVQDEDVALAARIAQIERDDNFQSRERLIGHGGEWQEALAEAARNLAPFEATVQKHEALPSFKELIETGYDTPEYKVAFYNFKYYRLWKHADEACEKLAQEPFALVRQLYLDALEKRNQRKAKHTEVLLRVQNLTRLVNEHDAKIARREALRGPAPLTESREAVGEWLAKLNRRALADTLKQAGRLDLLNAVMKLDGIEAKSAYLESMIEDDLAADLRAEMSKLDHDMVKYARPKKAGTRFPAAAIQKRFHDRPARYHRRIEQRRAIVERVYDWDDYDYVDYDDWGTGVPWWYFITGRSDPGYGARFGDVDHWHSSHSNWSYVRHKRAYQDDSPMDDAAAALANQHVDDGGRDVS